MPFRPFGSGLQEIRRNRSIIRTCQWALRHEIMCPTGRIETIEGFNRQLRKVTKSKSVFPTDDSLLKMLYLAMMDITKKWTGRRMDWSMIHAQLMIFYGDRMPE